MQLAGLRIHDLERDPATEDEAGDLCGTPASIADRLRPYVDAGFAHFLVDMRRPYDAETIARLPEVRALLAG